MKGQQVTATVEYVTFWSENMCLEYFKERGFIWFTHYNLNTQETMRMSIKDELPPNFSPSISFNKVTMILRIPGFIYWGCTVDREVVGYIFAHKDGKQHSFNIHLWLSLTKNIPILTT